MPVGEIYAPSVTVDTDFLENIEGRVLDSTSCGGSETNPTTGITKNFDVPTFTVSSVPVGVENFMTIDQIKGEFVISPLTDAHKGFFKVRIEMNLPSKPGAD